MVREWVFRTSFSGLPAWGAWVFLQGNEGRCFTDLEPDEDGDHHQHETHQEGYPPTERLELFGTEQRGQAKQCAVGKYLTEWRAQAE